MGEAVSLQVHAEDRVVGRQLVLGDLDDEAVEIVGQDGLDLGRRERRRAEVQRQVGTRRTAGHRQSRLDRVRLERRAEPDALGEQEPLVGAALRRLLEPRQRLEAGDPPGRERDERLEDRRQPVGRLE